MKILIVEDDRKMADLLRKGLEEDGHSAAVAYDGQRGLEMALSSGFDNVVLDVMLPGLNGFEISRRLRAAGTYIPILMLTGRDATTDVVHGLEAGADDYLTKPFSFEVLLARLKALERRRSAFPPARLKVADLILDLETREVRRGRHRIELTKTEFSILDCLMQRPGRIVTRSTLIEAVWGLDREIENNTLDAFIRLLRNKLEGAHGKRLIRTIRGVGYSLREEEPA